MAFRSGYQVFGEGTYDLVLERRVDGQPRRQLGRRRTWRGSCAVWAQRARVITFDRRGFGISDRPGTQGQMAIEKSLDDMRAVMDAAGSERGGRLRVRGRAPR